MSNSVLKDKDKNILNFKIPRYEKKLLWENPSPNSNFKTQNISLSDPNYKFLLIAYYNWVTDKLEQVAIMEKGCNGALMSIVYENSIYISIRAITSLSSTELKVTDAYTAHFGANNIENLNGHCVPVKIYGLYS